MTAVGSANCQPFLRSSGANSPRTYRISPLTTGPAVEDLSPPTSPSNPEDQSVVSVSQTCLDPPAGTKLNRRRLSDHPIQSGPAVVLVASVGSRPE